ncbi:MAG: trypsin-like peptidase domain-containing protein [Candidatus Rokubacteria bacterium]|nr:trypsin-like peptidase domain-containing protein [Candidatus Rokubacteria bacterium]
MVRVFSTIVLAVVAIALYAGSSAPYIPELNVAPSGPPPTVPEIYAKVSPTIVTIRSGGSQGSGVILTENGDILTALHVLKDPSKIEVTFADGSKSDAKILQTIPENDIAAIRPSRNPDILPAVFGDPSKLTIGDPAIVIGTPFGLSGSLTTGVISGLDRSLQPPGFSKPLDGLIQFDASVNSGNSGGPLLNRDGEVVGIVTAIVSPSGTAQFSGLGFAVTIRSAGGAIGLPPD